MLSVPRLRLLNKTVFCRSFQAGNPNLISEKDYQKFKLKQARMQRNINLPTYLVCGTRDKVVHYAMWTLTICSGLINIKYLYKLSQM